MLYELKPISGRAGTSSERQFGNPVIAAAAAPAIRKSSRRVIVEQIADIDDLPGLQPDGEMLTIIATLGKEGSCVQSSNMAEKEIGVVPKPWPPVLNFERTTPCLRMALQTTT
jgi:hypothetical protein